MAGIDSSFYNYFKKIQEEHVQLNCFTQMQWNGMLAQWNLGKIVDYVLIAEYPDSRPVNVLNGHPEKLVTAAFTVAHRAKANDVAGNNIIYDEIEEIIDDIIARIIADLYPVRAKDFFIRKLNDDFNVVATLPLNSNTFIGKRCQFSYVAAGGIKYKEDKWQHQ